MYLLLAANPRAQGGGNLHRPGPPPQRTRSNLQREETGPPGQDQTLNKQTASDPPVISPTILTAQMPHSNKARATPEQTACTHVHRTWRMLASGQRMLVPGQFRKTQAEFH